MPPLHPNAFCQLALHSDHLEATLAFFEEVFAWKVVPISLHAFTVIEVPGDSTYGISVEARTRPASGEQAVIPYFRWDEEIATLLTKSEKLGGKLLWGPRPVPAYGDLYLIEVPGGIQLGFFQAA